MPIYRGETLFLDALDSVEKAEIPFKKIILSFNSVTSRDYDLFCQEKKNGRFLKDYTVLRTNIELSSVNHAIFITNYLKLFFLESLQVFFLAHDDRILNHSNDEDLFNFLENTKSDSIYFPSYSNCNAKDYSKIIEIIESEQIINSDDFFWLTQRQNVPTSMSGMIVPLGAWIDTLDILKKAGSGARFEHLLCIARCINNIYFTKKVKVLIAQRKNSDADKLKPMHHRISALYYILTFSKNGRIVGGNQYLLYSWILFKSLVGLTFECIKFK
jgi:hypothetical protein